MDADKSTNSSALEGNRRLEACAARARETDQLAQDAEAEVTRLRKELKRARKAYKEAKEAARDTAKAAEQARHELSQCLDGAFRDLAMTVQATDAARDHSRSSPQPVMSKETSARKAVPLDSTAAAG